MYSAKLLFLAFIIRRDPFVRPVQEDVCRTREKKTNEKADDRELKTRITTAYRKPVKPHGASHVLCLSPYHMFLAPMSTVWARALDFRCLAQGPASCVACAHNATYPRAANRRLEVGRPCGCPTTPWLCQYTPRDQPIWWMRMCKTTAGACRSGSSRTCTCRVVVKRKGLARQCFADCKTSMSTIKCSHATIQPAIATSAPVSCYARRSGGHVNILVGLAEGSLWTGRRFVGAEAKPPKPPLRPFRRLGVSA